MADSIFQHKHQLALVLEGKDCHSDIEDAPAANLSPVSVSPPWQSVHLTSILHNLYCMVQAQATHHKTIETNKRVYARSNCKHASGGIGIIRVARDWPTDCYNQTFWNGLSQFEREAVSSVPPIGSEAIAEQLTQRCGRGSQHSSSGVTPATGGNRAQKRQQNQREDTGASSGGVGTGGAMNVD